MPTDIDSLKRQPGILSIYQSRVQLKRDGKEYVGLCPFHSEKTPSFRISNHQGVLVWKCFGQCGTGGDILSFVQKINGVTFIQAIEKVKQELGHSFSQTKQADKIFSSLSELKPIVSHSLEEYRKYEKALETSQAGQAWLKSRGISYETAKKLHIGFRQDVGKLGKANNNLGWLSFPSIMGDRVLSIKYRNIGEKTFCKQPGMSKGDQTPLFNSETIEPLEPVYLVEGEPDCLVMEQAGFKSCSVQSSSTPLTAANKEKLLEADYIMLAGDNTPDGNAYMDKAWAEIQERVYKLTWPLKDANQVFLETCKGDIQKFRELVITLTTQAKSNPMPNISSLQEVMLTSGRTNLTEHPQRLRFPWKAVDEMAVIVPGGVASVMATSTKQGKTTWVMQTSVYAAMKGEVVLNYQCELSPEEFSTMVAAHVLRKDRNHLSDEDYKNASKLLNNIRYYIGRDPTLSTVNPVLDLIEAGIRRLGATVVILDHVHFICRNEANEVQAQANAMQRIKRMAIQYKVKFIVVGQPRKAQQQFKGKLVDISDWKGSEAGGSDSDAVFAIHRDRIQDRNETSTDDYDPVTTIHLLGCRSRGDGGTYAKLLYLGKLATFSAITAETPPGEEHNKNLF